MTGRDGLAAWQALAAHAETLRGVHLRELFAADAGRFERFSGRLDDLLVDWSKQRVTTETMALLVDLANGDPFALQGPTWAGPGQPSLFQATIPPTAGQLVGLTVHLQGVLFDLVSKRWTLTEGVDLLVGP